MHSNSVGDRCEIEAVGNEFEYKLHRFVHIYSLDSVAHAVEARRLVAKHRVFAIVGCFKESLLEFGRLLVGKFGHTFALPDSATAEIFHIFREYDFEASLFEELHRLLHQRSLVGVVFGNAHSLIDARREVDNF